MTANQQAWETVVGADMLDMATEGFITLADGVGLTTRPTPSGGSAFRIGFGSSIPESTKNAQWQAFRAAIYNAESWNLFYLGHGDTAQIGYSSNTNRMIGVECFLAKASAASSFDARRSMFNVRCSPRVQPFARGARRTHETEGTFFRVRAGDLAEQALAVLDLYSRDTRTADGRLEMERH